MLVSLDNVKGAFDSAWCPSILNGLKACDCPQNLYNFTKSYFSQRSAVLSTNSVRMLREISKGCRRGSCCGPGILEHSVQFFAEPQIYETNKSHSIC